ncbi:hypothetical protein PXH69_24710 [Rhodococcus qingshengii]|uniref:TMhelix containing protein n=1 Tax=Rhodococcus qingshengii TaxID=334542 RepID=A0AAW6LUT0_RHOSG|nr:hypothetical protein [Rhodococcus qingshengii]MDE8648173.1 hypothetical protein [Rhodococcus qingshengii]
MNQNQKALINGLMTIAACIVLIGVGFLLWDGTHMTEVCTTKYYETCVNEPIKLRGFYFVGAGTVALIGLFVAQSQLSKDDEVTPLIS